MPAVVIQEVIQVYIKGRDVSPDKARARRLRDTRCLEVEVDGILMLWLLIFKPPGKIEVDHGPAAAVLTCAPF